MTQLHPEVRAAIIAATSMSALVLATVLALALLSGCGADPASEPPPLETRAAPALESSPRRCTFIHGVASDHLMLCVNRLPACAAQATLLNAPVAWTQEPPCGWDDGGRIKVCAGFEFPKRCSSADCGEECAAELVCP